MRQLLDHEYGVEERRAGAAELLGNFDAHDAEVEEAGDEALVHHRVVVHLRDEGTNFFDGELAHALREHLLFFGKDGQRCAGVELEGGGGHWCLRE